VILPDVNVLVYAHREDAVDHAKYREWLEQTVNSRRSYGMTDFVLSGFLRIVTHPKVFRDPSSLSQALEFVSQLRDQPNCVHVVPGERHWSIFTDLTRTIRARGNHIPDAYLAALAIESGCEWITTDRDYARFTELRWSHPLDR
jgi:uncharacterized protein